MLPTLLTALLAAAPAMAVTRHLKTQGDTFDLCIDNTDGKLQAGNPLQVWKCYTGSKNQAWTFEDTGKYPTTIALGDSTEWCLGVEAKRSPVVLTHCSNGYDSTTWSAPGARICLLGTNWCVQLDEDCAHDGTRLKVSKLSDSASQAWDVKQPA